MIRILASACVAMMGLGVVPMRAAVDDPAFVKSSTLKVSSWRLAKPAVSFEYPAKDWIDSGSGVTTLATLVQRKGEASMLLEYEATEFPTLAVNDTFLGLEQDRVAKIRAVTAMSGRILQTRDHGIAILEYTEQSAAGPDRVRIYVMPVGREVFRLICRAGIQQFPKYQEVFSHAAASIVLGGPR
jgi:hypothetical protein